VQSLVEDKEDVIIFREVDVYKDPSTADKYEIQATPTVIILDANGKEIYNYAGIPEEEEVQEAIDQATAS
jgi:thioredoxin-like negative regulator of GroEL